MSVYKGIDCKIAYKEIQNLIKSDYEDRLFDGQELVEEIKDFLKNVYEDEECKGKTLFIAHNDGDCGTQFEIDEYDTLEEFDSCIYDYLMGVHFEDAVVEFVKFEVDDTKYCDEFWEMPSYDLYTYEKGKLTDPEALPYNEFDYDTHIIMKHPGYGDYVAVYRKNDDYVKYISDSVNPYKKNYKDSDDVGQEYGEGMIMGSCIKESWISEYYDLETILSIDDEDIYFMNLYSVKDDRDARNCWCEIYWSITNDWGKMLDNKINYTNYNTSSCIAMWFCGIEFRNLIPKIIKDKKGRVWKITDYQGECEERECIFDPKKNRLVIVD